MDFREKVKRTFKGKNCLRNGLQAIKNEYKSRINVKNPRELKGSVNIEICVGGGRWDYVIGYKDDVYFIEIHTATKSSEIDIVIEKARWLRNWKENTPFKKDNKLYWISPGKVGFSQNSTHFRKLRIEGIHFAGSRLRIPPSN